MFISWSGERSQRLAELLKGWIPNVIQTVECFYSDTGIRAGDRWNEEINAQLEETDFGILCVTPANIGAAWLNYEAGALAKRVTAKSRVVPVTMGFAPGTLPAPLRQFNGVSDDREGFKKLITSIAEAAQSPVDVNEVFDVWWPQLETKLAQLPGPTADASPPAPPSTEDVLSEVLGIVQGLQQDLARTRADIRTRGKFADPSELFDLVMVARILEAEPEVRKQIVKGDISVVRALQATLRQSNLQGDSAWVTPLNVFTRRSSAREAQEDRWHDQQLSEELYGHRREGLETDDESEAGESPDPDGTPGSVSQ